MKRLLFAALFALGVAAPAWAQQRLGTPSWATAQVSVLSSATRVAVRKPTRNAVTVITTGTNQVYCGPDNTVAAGTGTPINPSANSAITIQTTAEVWCIASSTQTVAVMESF